MDYKEILCAAFMDLRRAAEIFLQNTSPVTTAIRPRFFEIYPGFTWPYFNKTTQKPQYYYCEHLRGGCMYLSIEFSFRIEEAAVRLIGVCDHQPRRILRALRRIQAATAWCEARTEGRRRAAEEILRQQQKSVEALEGEAAMLAIRG